MRSSLRIIALFLYNSCLGVFLTYGLFFNRVSAEFSISASLTSLIFGIFALTYSISSLMIGFLMDSYGVSFSIMLGGFLMGTGLILSGFSSSSIMLTLFYGIIGGLGTGSMWLPTSLVTLESFEGNKIKNTIGIVSAGTAFGTLIFAPVEGVFISFFGWRIAFVAVGIIVLIFSLFAYLASKDVIVKRSFDLKLAIKRIKSSRFVSYYLYYMFGNAFSRTLTMIFIVPLIESRGINITISSLALSLIGAGSMIGRLATGLKINEEKLASIGFLLQGLSTFIFVFLYDPISLLVNSLAFGIGYGMYIPQFSLIIRKNYGTAQYGTIFGILLTSFGIGAFIGPIFEGLLITYNFGYIIGFVFSSLSSIIVGFHILRSS
jgi:OFA family oxalate/formate antiporter-like MFS transporter